MFLLEQFSTFLFQEWAKSLVFIFGGCCSTIIALENIVSIKPNSGNLVTLCQFLFVSIEGLLKRIKFNSPKSGKKLITMEKHVVPIYYWVIMVLMFFSSSLLNSWAFYYQISVPLHIIFRSGSLLMNMLFSALLLKKKYTFKQVFDVILVTLGIIIATLTSAHEKMTESKHSTFIQWVIGIIILLLALIIGSVLGVYQEVIYSKYGRVWKEALFYSHTISIPFFLLFTKDIIKDINKFNEFPLVSFSLKPFLNFSFSIHSSWIYLSMNILSQYFCVTGVHKLSSISTALTLNLILSLRKFVSLLLSIFIFKNPLKLGHWIGTIILFAGTVMYFKDTPSKISSNKKEHNSNKNKKSEKEINVIEKASTKDHFKESNTTKKSNSNKKKVQKKRL
ncbi:UAA transporter [Neocallimastix lanati (nom. inval.)]|jgi:UDP-xylose/UDP-N-acetylglucosamine transporter B4|uniref:UAA transporter n=1 Tax=Neocallimastix californiae TaxID=1754190 RepID=A0A1Y2FR31_9FUNG|nr:UAA transporter [Neocallimastix sp. JGI-2020a]ORY85774.1 UAA transporter [Neocallimastix californiae]|eukprot:ORY85774.1 UAA transporter [Neocallimastix californiae]